MSILKVAPHLLARRTAPARPVVPKPRPASLEDRICAAEQFARFEASYDKINAGLEVKKMQRELLHLHGTRRIRSMDSSDILANAQVRLIDANMQNQAYRSRAAEIRMQLFIAASEIEELNDRFWKWASTYYMAELVALGHKSQAAQWNFISNLIDYSITRLTQINTAIKVADAIIDDLDQCGWALKRVESAVALSNKDKFAS